MLPDACNTSISMVMRPMFRPSGQLATAYSRQARFSSPAYKLLRSPTARSKKALQTSLNFSKVERACRDEASAL